MRVTRHGELYEAVRVASSKLPPHHIELRYGPPFFDSISVVFNEQLWIVINLTDKVVDLGHSDHCFDGTTALIDILLKETRTASFLRRLQATALRKQLYTDPGSTLLR